MAALPRPSVLAGALGAGTVAVALGAMPSVRNVIGAYVRWMGRRGLLKVAAVLFALLNLKNLPFMWHYRVIRGIVYQIFNTSQPQRPAHLFAPIITDAWNSPLDCDYNLHKSNSTYFADLDVSRAHSVGQILRTGLNRLNRGDDDNIPPEVRLTPGSYFVALGAIACHFRREIEPLQRFEIHTRVLAWDRKWLYIVSHMVRKGKVRPQRYLLQPWKKSGSKSGEMAAPRSGADLIDNVFATSISRYVFKKGRMTLNPEAVLERSCLLPPRPPNTPLPPRTESEAPTPPGSNKPALESAPESGAAESVATQVTTILNDGPVVGPAATLAAGDMTWEEMETERLRGLRLAAHLTALDELHGELREGDALGHYGEWFY